jgi:16S rRNA (guanine527-N7)-methyltransferase
MATDPLDAVLAQARHLGFLGPGPVEVQRAHAEAFAGVLDGPPALAVDLGSGGGVPGLVLAARFPESRWVLVDAMAKRTAFLAAAVDTLGFGDRVEVCTVRAEELGRRRRAEADLVVARSFAAPPVTAECGAPLLQVGGALVVSEPPGGAADRWNAPALARLGLVVEAVLPGPPAFVRLRQASVCPEKFPRRTGLPRKRPLWT